MPIVESRESKIRSKEGILRSFRSSKHESMRIKNLRFSFFWLAPMVIFTLHLSSSFRPFPRALSMCFHVFCSVLRTPAMSFVHDPRFSQVYRTLPGGGLGGQILPIVESRESKTRSEERILPSFRISKHKSVRRQNMSQDFLWLGRQTRHLHLSSSFRPLPRALLMCFHVICPVLRASAVSSVHTRRCSHQCSPPATLAEDLAPISDSKQPARVLRGLEAPSRCR